MDLLDKDAVLKDIPLFSDLSAPERAVIKRRCSIVEYKKNQIIYEEGSPADAFYCLVLGRVLIYTRDQSQKEVALEYLHRGKYFGIISLLTGEGHSVTARVINDALLLVIKKEDFDFILKKIPRLAIDLSQTLSRRLKNKDIHHKTIFESTIISIFSSYTSAGKSICALNLAISLNKETRKSSVILDICPEDKMHSLPAKLGIKGECPVFKLFEPGLEPKRALGDFLLKNNYGADLICLSYKSEEESCVKKLLAIISLLVNEYHYIVLDLPAAMDRTILSILNQSDLIYILTSPESMDLKKTRHLVDRLIRDFQYQEGKIRVIINEYKHSHFSCDQQLAILGYNIFATLPKIEFGSTDRLVLDAPDSEYAKAIRRISRQAGDCIVGLALGVGIAYGFCHIGVLKVIEEEKIPIDVVSGSSIGALIASLWAIGKSSAEILEITREFREPKYIWGLVDFTFPRLGFIKGNKLYKFLKRHLGDKTFYDVRLPLKIIASDVKRKEPRVLDKGLLTDAIMASCAMPGVFRPFRFKEETLFDGGVINPLPTEVLFQMGARKIIAVNVTPSREDIIRQYEELKQKMSIKIPQVFKQGGGFSLKQFLKDKFRLNILDIIFSSIEIMQSEMAQKEAQLADIVLHPDTSGLYWLELHRADDFARRGEEEARKNIDRIRRVIEE
ncbi:MAG: patatin-like phospholipase family protein [Candidatus Omnitrophota bacterium]